eukprot:6186648-Pleurochrysis_carterae.AAC.1
MSSHRRRCWRQETFPQSRGQHDYAKPEPHSGIAAKSVSTQHSHNQRKKSAKLGEMPDLPKHLNCSRECIVNGAGVKPVKT